MKLAEGLVERADLQKRFKEVHSRINSNLIVEEGGTSDESIEDLLKEADSIASRLQTLVTAINRTNSTVAVSSVGTTIMEMLAKRDRLAMMRNLYQALSNNPAANYRHHRSTKEDIKFVATFDHRKMREEADRLAKEYRTLDTAIQALNWEVDLVL